MAPSLTSNRPPLLYLACPYTDPDVNVRLRRFQHATEAAAFLIAQGHIVFSPITMTHPIDLVLAGTKSTMGSDYWVAFDQAFMDRCDELVLLEIEGWRESSGVMREIEYFLSQGKPLWAIDGQFARKPLNVGLSGNRSP